MSAILSTLPELDSDYTVTAKQTSDYQRDGHMLLRGLASREEVNAYLPLIADSLEKHRKERRALAERGTYHKAFIQVANLWELDENVKRFVMARRFAKAAAELMGVSGVRIFHDQALFKEPGGGHTPWHQDQFYWPIDSDNTITMWMALDDTPVEKGPMVFASGVHKKGPLANIGISDVSAEVYTKLAKDNNWPLATYELNAGDATFHSGWTPHKAPGNSSSKMRPVMTVIYMADGVRVSEPMNDAQPLDMARWFPGRKPGDLADTELNPLVYSRG